jgi:hypothetical protein
VDREQAAIIAGFSSTTRANARLLSLSRAGLLSRFFVGSVARGRRAVYRTRTRRRPWKAESVDHQLEVNWIHLLLLRPPSGTTFRRWRWFPSPPFDFLPLVPDGYAELERDGRAIRLYVEVDLGTESGPVWRKKAEWYVRLALRSESRFRVLVVARSARRTKGISRAVRMITPKLFYFSDFSIIKREGLFSPVWLRPEGEERQSLL